MTFTYTAIIIDISVCVSQLNKADITVYFNIFNKISNATLRRVRLTIVKVEMEQCVLCILFSYMSLTTI
jgi:hypothetical protein